MTNHDPKHAPDNDNGGEHEPEKKVAAPAPAGGALASLEALGAALNKVDTSTVLGGSGKPLLQFKSREGGIWAFGRQRTMPEPESCWAVNPATFKRGYVCFGEGNRKLGEVLLPVSLPMPDVTQLPDKGFPWMEQWAVDLKCTSGSDAGVEVIYKANTVGGTQSIVGLLGAVRDRINGGQHNGKVAPIVKLERNVYPHGQHGKVWTPVPTIIGWMPLGGPAPAPEPAPSPPPVEQPRRRRVA